MSAALVRTSASGGTVPRFHLELRSRWLVPNSMLWVLFHRVSLISQSCRFDIWYNFYWYSDYIDIHYIVIIDKPCVITSFIFSVDFPVQTSCPNRHNYGTNQFIKMFLPTELCPTSVHISTLFLNMSYIVWISTENFQELLANFFARWPFVQPCHQFPVMHTKISTHPKWRRP